LHLHAEPGRIRRRAELAPGSRVQILILKTGALGDVLRTTAILPGLRTRYAEAEITWLTATGAGDLVRHHPDVARVVEADPKDEARLAELGRELAATRWDRVLSFDDEEPLCRLASSIAGTGTDGVLSGAYLTADGARTYTKDVAPWFDMGLLSVHGKEEADRRKVQNTESHPAIFARMLGIEMGEPFLPLPPAALAFAAAFAERTGLHDDGPVIGLNTGAGGRWESKRLPIERVTELMNELTRRREGRLTFLLLGGPGEEARNTEILGSASSSVRLIDGGVGNALLDFAALVSRLDLLVTSDSLALHMANALRIPQVAFFAPTSAAEIELYGRGEKVASTSADACSYRADADTSTLTVGRLAAAVERVLP